MSFKSVPQRYDLQQLAIGTSAGEGPFICENSVARIPEGQELSGANAAPASIWQNDDYPFEFGDVLTVEFAAKLPSALGANDEIFVGLAGAKAAIGSLAYGVGFHFEDSSVVKCGIVVSGTFTEEATAFTLTNSYRRFVVDLFSGVQTISPPGVSKGGLGQIKFSVENDDGQLTPVGKNTLFDLSAAQTTGAQILATAETTGAAVIDLAYIEVDYRQLP